MSILGNRSTLVFFGILFVGVLILGCSSSTSPPSISREQLGGKYNATIQTMYGGSGASQYSWKEITYTKNGVSVSGAFSDNLVGALEFIKKNIPEDAIFVSWWDNGLSIAGYTGRESIIETPSKEIADTVSIYRSMNEDEKKQFLANCSTPQTRIVDVARILTTDNTQEAVRIMKTYDASYLFISDDDKNKLWVSYRVLGEEPINQSSPEFEKLMIGRVLKGESIDGFEMVYSDGYVKIYHLK